MATPGRIKRRFYFHVPASEWVILRGKDNSIRKIRVAPKAPRVTFKDFEAAMGRVFVRQAAKTDDGFPLYLEADPEEAMA